MLHIKARLYETMNDNNRSVRAQAFFAWLRVRTPSASVSFPPFPSFAAAPFSPSLPVPSLMLVIVPLLERVLKSFSGSAGLKPPPESNELPALRPSAFPSTALACPEGASVSVSPSSRVSLAEVPESIRKTMRRMR